MIILIKITAFADIYHDCFDSNNFCTFATEINLKKISITMKKLFLCIALGAMIFANTGCGNLGKNADDATKVAITVDSFLMTPEVWANKDVLIKGTVSHVCRHSGKKLFLFGASPEKTVKVNTGGDFSSFDIKYEGTDVEITGTVIEDEKIDANYLNEWEADIKRMVSDKDIKVCTAESQAITGQKNDKAKVGDTVVDPYADVKEFRKKLVASGKTYISIYAINCKTMKEIKK